MNMDKNILISLDDETKKLTVIEWRGLIDKILEIVKAHATMAQSTEPVYLYREAGHERVYMVKGRVLKKHLKDIADLVQQTLQSLGENAPSASLHHTEFNESIIVTKDSVGKWKGMARK